MNLHIPSPGHRGKGRNVAPGSGSHDGLIAICILLALAVAAPAFWFHPFLTVLAIATLCALMEIARSVAHLCRVRARWSRLARRRNAGHGRHS